MELPTDIDSLKAIIYELLAEISRLKSENAELKARLNANSGNSSKPPSSDGYRKSAKILPGKNGIKGGQLAHQGATLRQVENPDVIKECRPADTCSCGHHFVQSEMYLSEKRQVFDLPPPKLVVSEHQIFTAKCPVCGEIHAGISPLKAPVQYGNGVKTLVSLLNTHYKMPLNKIKQFFDDLFGIPINEATILASNSILYQQLFETENKIKDKIKSSFVVNADETGMRINKNLHWIHTASTPLYTYLFAHIKRGMDAIKSEKGILSEFTNWLIHDCYSTYFGLDKAKHALCGAHIIRELQGIIDNNSSINAAKMQELLLGINKTDFVDRLKNRKNSVSEYEKICSAWEVEEPPPEKIEGKRGKIKKTKARNLLERLIVHKEKVLAFAFNEHVPFTNNLAERDLRPVKLKQKISNCFRSFDGAETYSRIESFISTCRKNNKNIFNEMYNSFNGYNFLTVNC
jgi:transposase